MARSCSVSTGVALCDLVPVPLQPRDDKFSLFGLGFLIGGIETPTDTHAAGLSEMLNEPMNAN